MPEDSQVDSDLAHVLSFLMQWNLLDTGRRVIIVHAKRFEEKIFDVKEVEGSGVAII